MLAALTHAAMLEGQWRLWRRYDPRLLAPAQMALLGRLFA
jgi:hypothetical protein